MTNKNKIGGYVQLNQQRRVVEATTRDQLWADKYYGAWQDDMSADDMANAIRESRKTGGRQLVSFE